MCYVEVDTSGICDAFGQLENVEVTLTYLLEGRFVIVRTGQTKIDDDISPDSTDSTSSDSTDIDYREYIAQHLQDSSSGGDDGDSSSGGGDERSEDEQ